jgi:drug/metabolite transporter (DMT)-like permease
MSFIRSSLFADAILFIVTLFWGATFVLVQDAVDKVPVFTFLGVRFLIAVFLLWLIQRIRGGVVRSLDRKTFAHGLILGVWLFGGYAFQTFGLLYTTPAKAGFITGLTVVLVPILSYFILKHKIDRFMVTGILLATAGLALISLNRDLSVNPGDLLFLFCTFAFAMQITLTGKYVTATNSLNLTIVQILTVGVLSSICALVFEPWQTGFQLDVIFDPEVITAYLVCSVFATALAFLAQTYFQQYTTTTHTALIFSCEPVFAAITSWLWTHEQFTARMLTGCVLILFGMLISEGAGLLWKPKQDTESERS